MSEEPEAGMNLDPEMLAAYIDNRLTPEQRAVVEAQLASDPDSYAVLVETIKALDEIKLDQSSMAPRARKTFARRWTIAAGFLTAAAALILVARLQPELIQRIRGERTDPGLSQLVAAVGEERLIDGRLTGGFAFGPMRPIRRGLPEVGKNLEVLTAAGEIERNFLADPTGENLHRWGVAQLITGRADEAIQTLERAAAREPSSPSIAVDLSAAYLERASQQGNQQDLAKALSLADRSLAALPSNPEALFNRAMALTRLNRVDEARTAWSRYLQVDASSGWSSIARQQLPR